VNYFDIMPKVSVIIPAYNRAHLIPAAIQSVLDQTYRDFEIIVIDDGSIDATKEAVNSFKDARINYIYQQNSGVASARNNGITASRGEYLALLDSDDAWLPDYLSLMVEKLDAHPQAALVCSDCFICNKDLDEILQKKWHNSAYDTIEPDDAERHPLKYLLRSGCFISPQSTVLRKSILNNTGLFDETLVTHEDLELFIRIVREHPVKLIDIPLVKFRKNDNGLQSRYEQMCQDDITVMKRTLAAGGLAREEKRFAIKRLAHAYHLWGWYAFYKKDSSLGWRRLFRAIMINPWDSGPYIFIRKYLVTSTKYSLKKKVLPKLPIPVSARLKQCYNWLKRDEDK